MPTGIELRPHACIPAERWQSIRPKLRLAADLALHVSAEYGMELKGRKYNNYHAVSSRYVWFGEATTNKTSSYFLKPGMINGRIDVGYVACKNLHELVHQFRGELYELTTVGEWAATEGVAHNIDYLSRKDNLIKTWNYKQTPVVEFMEQMPEYSKRKLYDDLAADMFRPAHDEVMLDKWGAIESKRGLRKIDMVGIAAVRSQIVAGLGAEVWQLPKLSALGYEETYETAA